MDDYSITSLSESKNEWCARLVNTLTPTIIQGMKSIFDESWKLCRENEEEDKYLMTFQTFLSRVPKWNEQIIEAECKRIEETSNCGYLEELITCVHIIQLKALSCVRVGQKQKKVDIDIPSSNLFIHRCYSNVARKIYTNVYLFEKDIPPLQIQKNSRELETIIKECIMNSIRESMPIESLLRAYMNETEEESVEIFEEIIPSEPFAESISFDADSSKADSSKADSSKANSSKADSSKADVKSSDTIKVSKIEFSNVDTSCDIRGNIENMHVSKDIENLEKISAKNDEKQLIQNSDEDNCENSDKIKIGSSVNLDFSEVNDLSEEPLLELDDIEILS